MIESFGNTVNSNLFLMPLHVTKSEPRIQIVDYCNRGNYNEVPFIAFMTSCSATLSKCPF